MTKYEDLAGKVVLVTGGARGLGEAIVRAFHGQGCKVALNYNSSKEQADALAAGLGGVEIFRADVADGTQVRKMVGAIEAGIGTIDVLVNNAGLSYEMELERFVESEFERMWRVNVLGPVNTSLAVMPGMKRSGGTIINIASHAGIGNTRAGGTFYAATKSALIMLTKRMAVELGTKHGIRVNAIAPGVIRTDSEGIRLGAEEEIAFEEQLGLRRAIKIKGLPRHIADAALFLGSRSSEFVTGQVLVVDGGRLDGVPRSV